MTGRARPGRSHREQPVAVSESLGLVAERLGLGRPDVVGVVFAHWEEVVGAAMAAHVRPVRIESGTLLVVADHPAWATQTRQLGPDIVARIAERCGGGDGPSRVEVRVRR